MIGPKDSIKLKDGTIVNPGYVVFDTVSQGFVKVVAIIDKGIYTDSIGSNTHSTWCPKGQCYET